MVTNEWTVPLHGPGANWKDNYMKTLSETGKAQTR
jgi:hypothetical protein